MSEIATHEERFARRHPARAARVLAHLIQKADECERRGAAEAAVRERERAQRWAEGLGSQTRCLRCGRRLTDPDSTSRGIGPDCLARFGGAQAWEHYIGALMRPRDREEASQ